jgi:serine protease AprX
MPVPIPRRLVDFILLGPVDDRRQLQESPILGDVWIAFANEPDQPQDLLIEPYETAPAGRVAAALTDSTKTLKNQERNIAYVQGIVAARLTFDAVIRHVVPMTYWWSSKEVQKKIQAYTADRLVEIVDGLVAAARFWEGQRGQPPKAGPLPGADLTPMDRYVALTGLIHWAVDGPSRPPAKRKRSAQPASQSLSQEFLSLLDLISGQEVAERLLLLFQSIGSNTGGPSPLVWQVSLNRRAVAALERSIPAVKADAARTLFKINCEEITWAVVDAGIDASHPVFLGKDNRTRVIKSLDFSVIRQVISLDNLQADTLQERAATLRQRKLLNPLSDEEARSSLDELAQDARRGRPIHWELVERFVEVSPEEPPYSHHGTHVAGIIGARRPPDDPATAFADGMCPDIKLIDVRVLARNAADTEFAVIAALQYLRHLNSRSGFMMVHGANLSLSIPHDVRNYACGRTPVCNECERLVESGVVVVAAAGNRGYHSFETREGAFEGYAAFSITDPGNADGVITVGSTHRYWPHTYGVSFFSSRGPTGDGRLKPDLVAPGERIHGPLPNGGWGQQDGTSMAAPHVSGAAAMLMARYSELIGQPRRIKRVICDTATELDRERSFQGNGMLDVLRALQSM